MQLLTNSENLTHKRSWKEIVFKSNAFAHIFLYFDFAIIYFIIHRVKFNDLIYSKSPYHAFDTPIDMLLQRKQT